MTNRMRASIVRNTKLQRQQNSLTVIHMPITNMRQTVVSIANKYTGLRSAAKNSDHFDFFSL